MKGSIYFQKDRGRWIVSWFEDGKIHKITRYNGELMYHRKIAEKCLASIQARKEDSTHGLCRFDIREFTGKNWSDTIDYLETWIEAVEDTLSPATYKDYRNSIRNHLIPFFRSHPVMLHEIQYDTLVTLLNSIKRSGKGKLNVMYCIHACLKFAWKSRRIPDIPPFPERNKYKIQEPTIKWLPEDRQMSIINAIPEINRPVFLWLKYHLRRPGEACVLKWSDYNEINQTFIVRRSISARQVVERTKTGVEHIIPCHVDFIETARVLKANAQSLDSFVFINPLAREDGKRHTLESLNIIWKKACAVVGESIDLYSGLKHSSCSQYINEKGLSLSELQIITDHARLDSVKKYAKVEMDRKRALLERPRLSVVPNFHRKNTGGKK